MNDGKLNEDTGFFDRNVRAKVFNFVNLLTGQQKLIKDFYEAQSLIMEEYGKEKDPERRRAMASAMTCIEEYGKDYMSKSTKDIADAQIEKAKKDGTYSDSTIYGLSSNFNPYSPFQNKKLEERNVALGELHNNVLENQNKEEEMEI